MKLWPVMLFGLLAACAPKNERPVLGPQVVSVKFEGNGMFLTPRSNAALKNAIAHPVPRGLIPMFKKPVPLREDVLEEDKKRIAVHYAHNGYFDAELVEWRIEEVRPAEGQNPPQYAITGVVREGEPSKITSQSLTGAEGIGQKLERRLDRAVPANGPFTLRRHDLAKLTIEQELQEAGFAHATVEGKVEVDRDAHEIDLSYTTVPGINARFGEVTWSGDMPVPRGLILPEVSIEEGEVFTLSDIEGTRQRLYGTRLFSLVEIVPDMDQGEVVPVKLRLEKRKPRVIGGGVGIELQNGRQELLGRVKFEHVNAFQRWIGLRAQLQAGYAVVGAALGGGSSSGKGIRSGPVADVALGTRIPGIGLPGWAFDIEAAYERQLTETFIADKPTFTTAYAGRLFQDVSLSVAYRLRYTRYSDLQVAPEALDVGIRDLQDGQYFVTELEEKLIHDGRDDAVSPRGGMLNTFTLTQAGRFLGGSYDYLAAQVDLRKYLGLGRDENTVLALRAGAGGMLPYGPEERRAVPVAERFYLGGSDSVRGWVYQHLGPTVCEVETECEEVVPIGGTILTQASVEVRRYGRMFGAVVFSDWGMVWEDREAMRSQQMITPTVGVGGRVLTPVGPIRLDLAVRTDNVPRFANEPRLWLHFGLGEAF